MDKDRAQLSHLICKRIKQEKQEPQYTGDRILRRKEVEHMTGLCRSTIYNKMNEGVFPQPRKLTTKSVGWLLSDIQNWMNGLSVR